MGERDKGKMESAAIWNCECLDKSCRVVLVRLESHGSWEGAW